MRPASGVLLRCSVSARYTGLFRRDSALVVAVADHFVVGARDQRCGGFVGCELGEAGPDRADVCRGAKARWRPAETLVCISATVMSEIDAPATAFQFVVELQ